MDQIRIGKMVVNKDTVQRWYALGELHKMTSGLRMEVSRARNKKARRIANRKKRREEARAEWEAQNAE